MPKFLNLVFCSVFFFLSADAQNIKDARLAEISGIGVSTKSNNLLWVHNDSGDTSQIFLIHKTGATLAVYNFNKSVRDCEAMAIWYQKNNKSEIFIGDIGDNKAERPFVKIYRFLEPEIKNTSIFAEINIKNAQELKFKYPDGPRDAECLMVDPMDKKIYIISKRENWVSLYSAPLEGLKSGINLLKKETNLIFPGSGSSKWITSGDISANGKAVLIKSYEHVFYWDRKENESLVVSLKRKAKTLPYLPEKQGEALCFTKNGRNYYTISEGENAPVFYQSVK